MYFRSEVHYQTGQRRVSAHNAGTLNLSSIHVGSKQKRLRRWNSGEVLTILVISSRSTVKYEVASGHFKYLKKWAGASSNLLKG